MTKEQHKQMLKLIDNLGKLIETGFFPGHKAAKVLEALHYIQLMKEEANGHFKAAKKGASEPAGDVDQQAPESSEQPKA